MFRETLGRGDCSPDRVLDGHECRPQHRTAASYGRPKAWMVRFRRSGTHFVRGQGSSLRPSFGFPRWFPSCSENGTRMRRLLVPGCFCGKFPGLRRLPTLNIQRILAELRMERRRLERAIAALEKIAPSPKKSYRPVAERRSQGARTIIKDRPGHDRQGKLLLFRKPQRTGRPKPSRAEEA